MKTFIKLLAIISVIMLQSCGKDFLDIKQDQRLVVPNSLDDFQKLLDNTRVINEASSHNLGLIGGDEYWITAAQFNTTGGASAPEFQRNAYIWANQVYIGRETGIDWNNGYSQVLMANLALEYTQKTERTEANGVKWDLLKGTALFLRALNYYNLAQLYCPVYEKTTAATALGLSLRTMSDPTVKVPRANVAATYDQILQDLTLAEPLLTDKPELLFRGSKASVYALLCRVQMQVEDYVKAEQSADACLKIQNQLLDYNTVNLSAALTFSLNGKDNPEVIYMDNAAFVQFFNNFNADTTLLKSYETGDLRYKAYWSDPTKSPVKFKGSYKGSSNTVYFTGLATDEVYLNRAECRIRNSKPQEALSDLNLLRKARFTGTAYKQLVSSDSEEIMKWVLSERRKELILRGTRWSDLRRLNKEPKYATTLQRILGAQRYELKPTDVRWTWPLPLEAIQNGGYTQNPR